MKITLDASLFAKISELNDLDCASVIKAIAAALREEDAQINDPVLRNFTDAVLEKVRISISRSKAGISGMKKRWLDNKTITKEYQKNNKSITPTVLLSQNGYQTNNKTTSASAGETSEKSAAGAEKDKKEKVSPHTPLYRERTENLTLKEKVKREKVALFLEAASELGLELPERFFDSYEHFIEHRLAGKNKLTDLAVKQNARDVKKCLDAGASVDFVCDLLDTAVANAWTGWFFRGETLKKIEAMKNVEKLKNTPAPGFEMPRGYDGFAF